MVRGSVSNFFSRSGEDRLRKIVWKRLTCWHKHARFCFRIGTVRSEVLYLVLVFGLKLTFENRAACVLVRKIVASEFLEKAHKRTLCKVCFPLK